MERSAVSAVLPWECFSTERSVVERSAVSAVLPWECFSTEAKRSGEICGFTGLFLKMFFDRAFVGWDLRFHPALTPT